MRLCSTCCHDAGCALRGDAEAGVVTCEEFDLQTAPDRPAEPMPAPSPLIHRSGFQGLCGNCLNQGTCHLAGCEGGIWHCEEYQ